MAAVSGLLYKTAFRAPYDFLGLVGSSHISNSLEIWAEGVRARCAWFGSSNITNTQGYHCIKGLLEHSFGGSDPQWICPVAFR